MTDVNGPKLCSPPSCVGFKQLRPPDADWSAVGFSRAVDVSSNCHHSNDWYSSGILIMIIVMNLIIKAKAEFVIT